MDSCCLSFGYIKDSFIFRINFDFLPYLFFFFFFLGILWYSFKRKADENLGRIFMK